ncbi:kinesin-like protein KIN-12E [Carica papaya]|uniref:kinesin-like protein KIN-12E n=1 Tax=Carica papaya TaxID=3649 RepID=UPI000B8CB345|nr:kinesin-like protein KIN-12E [Carica papaya]
MPFISETASAIKRRFGFQNPSISETLPSVCSSPDLLPKSVSRDNLRQSFAATSGIRAMGDLNDEEVSSIESAQSARSQSFEFDEDPSFWKDHNVQVIIRIRPLSGTEISLQGYSKCVKQESCQTITWTGHPESRFTFDLVADENVSQEKLFIVAGLPMVENCVAGYNSCMFAYGQTGSGKTHTMLGDIEGGTRRHSVNCGMTPRVFEHLFSRIQKEKEARKDEKLRFTCKCSFLEIYNEQILDLLDPSSSNLQLREDMKKGVYVENLKEIEVTCARDVIQQLVQGAANRKVAATNMNRASSRSHSVFTCIIESKWESQGVTHHRFARLNLVDLAGSERQKSSGAEGERLKEATNINKSLSTLGLVIMNLVNISNGKSLHVPYRDSKLTFLLQDSLGGNSKTIIIANISPSICCSLETLSTLKFAQRAKFIKNNAIVNEDASGDVIAMRMQIQELKKEVSRLRGLVNGGAGTLDNETLGASLPGCPESFNWTGLNGSFSPLTSDRKMSQKKDNDVALVGAFRRVKEKEIALEALAAENKAAMQLAKQREDEIQGLKMRLRFREAGIKRLESVAAGKLSAETHLLKEKEEYLKDIEILRVQVDRNQEVTRFAMENLQLKEELRRLKSFYEEGEREMMNEQIKVLQNKLLEALDWKLMHESDPFMKDNSNFVNEDDADGNILLSKEEGTLWRSSINEENEFLRMQAIQNKAEMDTLQKTLSICLEEKENLEKRVNDFIKELEEEKSSKDTKEEIQEVKFQNLSTDVPTINLNDQMELKRMVDAIAAASQKEAEAHETAIKLVKENDELRLKLKVLLEDNNKLIELYEKAAAENNYKGSTSTENALGNNTRNDNSDNVDEAAEKKEVDMKKVVENLEHQLLDLHEENEKLMGLYERAMQERDEFKRMVSSSGLNVAESREPDFPEKLVEVDDGECGRSDASPVYIEVKDSIEETFLPGLNVEDENDCTNPKPERSVVLGQTSLRSNEQDNSYLWLGNSQVDKENLMDCQEMISDENAQLSESTFSGDAKTSVEESGISNTVLNAGLTFCLKDRQEDEGNHIGAFSDMEVELLNPTTFKIPEDLNLVTMKLGKAEEKLSDTAKTVTVFGSLERALFEIDELSKTLEVLEDGVQEKQRELASHKQLCEEIKARKVLIDKKLAALRYSLSQISSSVTYYGQREVRARARVNASLGYFDKKKADLASLNLNKSEIEAAQRKTQQSEFELRNNLVLLKSKLDEENQRQENDKVLVTIDNIEKRDTSERNWQLSKATDLLKSEEEKTKLQSEVKQCREKLAAVREEFGVLDKKSAKIEKDIQIVLLEIQNGSKTLAEMENALLGVIQEKESLFEIRERGTSEIESMILEYQQQVFEADFKEAELKILEQVLQLEARKIEELKQTRAEATKKATELVVETRHDATCSLSEKIGKELETLHASLLEAKMLLEQGTLNGS